MISIAEAIEDAGDRRHARRDQAHRGQTAPDDRRRCHRLAQRRLIGVWRMPHLELTYPRPDIAVLTLNRPEKLNALSYDLVEDLHTALDGIRANNDCRVVVLTGAGRGFCSGLDLTDPSPREGRRRNGVPAVGHALAGTHRRAHHADSSAPPAGDRRGQRPRLRRRNGHRAGLRHPDRVRIGAVLHAVHQARPRRLRHRRQLHAAADRRRGPGVRPHPDRARSRRRRGAAAWHGLAGVLR